MVVQRFAAAIRQLLPQPGAMARAVMGDPVILIGQISPPSSAPMTLCVAESWGKDI